MSKSIYDIITTMRILAGKINFSEELYSFALVSYCIQIVLKHKSQFKSGSNSDL